MTNTASQWEVAGSKKSTKTNDLTGKKTTGMTTRKLNVLPSKIPVIETLKPLELENGMYDYFAEPDEEEIAKKQTKSLTKSPKADSAPVSPKQKKEEPINLLKSNIETKGRKKNAPLSPGKHTKNELETAIANLSIENFQQKYSQLEGLFPDNLGLVAMHMSAFLNQSLNDVPDVEPNQNHENESNMFPLNKLDRKIEKFLNNIISKLKRVEFEIVFDYCLNEIIKNENPKIQSNHGLRMFMQLLIKHNPNIVLANLTKTFELIYHNRHRHQRILIAVWSLAQAGYLNLINGFTIWFEIMLPLINIKHFNMYVASYLQVLLDHHKIDSKSIVTKYKDQYIISLDQYFKIYELANDKSLNVLNNKEAYQKFKSASLIIRALFMSNLEFSPETGLTFETMLLNLKVENFDKQNEYLEILSKCLFTNTDSLKVWQGLYSKNLEQSTMLINYLLENHNKKFRILSNMRETLVQFENETKLTIQNAVVQSPVKEDKKPYYINKKSQKTNLNIIEVVKFNNFIKIILKTNFKRVSFFSIMLRTFITFTLLFALFFYWDKAQNKSLYFKAGEKQLEKYGLRDDALRMIATTKKSYFNAQKVVNHHVPIWYKKTKDTVGPYSNKAWSTTVEYSNKTWITTIEYSNIAWNNTENFRNEAAVYLHQANEIAQKNFQIANKYVQENFPVVEKSLQNSADIVVKYTLQANDAVGIYTKKSTHYVGTQLLGWKKGELEKVFREGFKIASDSVNVGVQWITKSVRNLTAQ